MYKLSVCANEHCVFSLCDNRWTQGSVVTGSYHPWGLPPWNRFVSWWFPLPLVSPCCTDQLVPFQQFFSNLFWEQHLSLVVCSHLHRFLSFGCTFALHPLSPAHRNRQTLSFPKILYRYVQTGTLFCDDTAFSLHLPPHPITMSTVGNAKGSLRENELSMHHKSGLGYYFLMLGSLVRLWSLWWCSATYTVKLSYIFVPLSKTSWPALFPTARLYFLGNENFRITHSINFCTPMDKSTYFVSQ